jgi:predicted DNA-binding transcriptional regulator AlpA
MRAHIKKELKKSNAASEQRALAYIADPLALIRKKDLAKLLGVNVWTIDNWRRAGKFPEPITLSHQIVAWRRADIDRWLIERQLKPIATTPPKPAPRIRENAEEEPR